MGTLIFIIIAIVVLSAIKAPRRSSDRHSQPSGGGLPWTGTRKRSRRKKSKYYWDD